MSSTEQLSRLIFLPTSLDSQPKLPSDVRDYCTPAPYFSPQELDRLQRLQAAGTSRPRYRACRQSGWGRAGHRQISSSACDLQLSLEPFSSSMSGNRRDERSMCEASVTLASRVLRRATQSLTTSKKAMSVFLMHPGAVSERPRLARPLEEHIF